MVDADMISWGAILYDVVDGVFYEAPVRENVLIMDGTGGRDSFASGVLAALLKGQDLTTAVNWGAAHGVLIQEVPGDITCVDEKAVLAEVNRTLKGRGVKSRSIKTSRDSCILLAFFFSFIRFRLLAIGIFCVSPLDMSKSIIDKLEKIGIIGL